VRDILASAEIASAFATVQRRASTDNQYPNLPAAMSAMYSVVSRTKQFSVKRMGDITSDTD